MHFLTCVNEASQDKTAGMVAEFLHFTLRGTARPSFIARIEGAHSDRAASASKKDGLAAPLIVLRSPATSSGMGADGSSSARVQRGPSEAAPPPLEPLRVDTPY